MKKSLIICLSISGLAFTGLSGPIFANDPLPEMNQEAERIEKVQPIKRAEFFRQQTALFSQADKNFNGQVTHDEILRLRHEGNKPKYVAAFKAVDTNNNGFISYEEVAAKHEEITEQQIARVLANKKNLLRRYDQDKDGAITSKELDEYFARQIEDKRDQSANNASKDMKLKDADDSGSVSLAEYLDSKTSSVIKFARDPQPTTEQTYTRDPNGDKIITRLENDNFIGRVFAMLDKNKDDELSADEQSNKAYERTAVLSTYPLYVRDRTRLK